MVDIHCLTMRNDQKEDMVLMSEHEPLGSTGDEGLIGGEGLASAADVDRADDSMDTGIETAATGLEAKKTAVGGDDGSISGQTGDAIPPTTSDAVQSVAATDDGSLTADDSPRAHIVNGVSGYGVDEARPTTMTPQPTMQDDVDAARQVVSGSNPPVVPPVNGDGENDATAKKIPAWVSPTVSAFVAVVLSLGIGYGMIASGAVTVPAGASMSSLGSTSGGGSHATGKTDVDAWSTVADSVKDSVVAISVENGQSVAKGSGAILDTDGNIVTNEHVVDGDGEIAVTLSNGQIYKAKRIGSDATTDLAVIRLINGPSDLKPVTFADSSKLTVGQGVLAVGNPLGYEDTATTGIVSALNRPVSVSSEETGNGLVVTNAIQIDAAINPGNSGGPTFDSDGEVIGVNSSIASTSGSSDSAGSIGIGFAIPSDLVQRVTGGLIKTGSVKHAQLGVLITSSTVTADDVTRVGAKITASRGEDAVVPGGTADEAGLKENDVIVGWDGEAVDGATSLMGYVRAAVFGSEHTITYVREGSVKNVEVTLDHEEKTVSHSDQNDESDGSEGFDPYDFFNNMGW